jgi:hypothetical protein
VNKTTWLAGTRSACSSLILDCPPRSNSTRSVIARLKREGTRAETRFGLSEKWWSPFKSAGESVQSTAGSRGVRISGQTMDRPCSEAQCKSSGYPLQSSISPSIPLPRVTVCHHVSNGLYHLIARSPALSSVPSYLRPGPRNIG